MLHPLPLAIALVIAATVWLFMRRGRIDLLRLRELLDQGAQLIDVRTVGEFDRGHIPGARNLPVVELSKATGLPTDLQQPLVVYCQSGARSALAARLLRRQGRPHVYDFGPIDRWPGSIERTHVHAPAAIDQDTDPVG